MTLSPKSTKPFQGITYFLRRHYWQYIKNIEGPNHVINYVKRVTVARLQMIILVF